MLQRVQVLREVHVLILQLISPLPDLVHGSQVLTELILEKKKRDEIRPTGQETWAESDVKPSTYSDSHHSAVETMEASPGDGAGVEVDQLTANGGEGPLNALQILQQQQDTAVTHCQGNEMVSASPGASLTPFPRTAGYRPSHLMLSGPFATGISYSCMQTLHCFPVSPLEQVHSPVRGSQEPPLHSHPAEFNNREMPVASFCAVTTQREGKEQFYSSCAITPLLIHMPLQGVSLGNLATRTGPQIVGSFFPPLMV